MPEGKESMLSQLIRSLNGSRRRSAPLTSSDHALESVTEDAHTRALLWPDVDSLGRQEDGVYPFLDDDNTARQGYFDLFDPQVEQNVRVLVAQDGTGGIPKEVLFDSKKMESPVAGTSHEGRKTVSFGAASPAASRVGASSLPGPMTTPQRTSRASSNVANVHARTISGQATPRTSDDLGGGSMFTRGRASFSTMRESGSPPVAARTLKDFADDEIGTFLDCMFGSTALSYMGPSTKIHWIPVKDLDSPGASSAGGAAERRTYQTALVTRVFTVEIEDEFITTLNQPTQTGQQEGSFVTPSPANTQRPSNDPKAFRRRKSPNYAIGLLIRIWGTSAKAASPASSGAIPRQESLASIAPHEFPSLASSVDSMIQMSWSSIFEDSTGGDYMASSRASSDSNDCEVLTHHWETILRILANLQSVASTEIRARLVAADMGPRRSHLSQNTRSVTFQDVPQRSFRLGEGELAANGNVRQAAKQAKTRIEQAVTTRYIIAGQDRWSIWRDESRWISRWAKQKERANFFQTVLTGFLAVHPEWLELLRCTMSREKRRHVPRAQLGDLEAIRSRTVIISPDRSVSRRLIFLLSSFLPGLQVRRQSPPKPRVKSSESSHQTFSVPTSEYTLANRNASDVQASRVNEHSEDGLKKARTAASVQRLPDSGISLVMQNSERRGSSSSRVTTLASSTSKPVAHFVTPQHDTLSSVERRGSNSSLASLKLSRSLRVSIREEPLTRVPSVSRAPSSYRWASLAGFWADGQAKGPTPALSNGASVEGNRRVSNTPVSSSTAPTSTATETKPGPTLPNVTDTEVVHGTKSEPVAIAKGPGTLQKRQDLENIRPGSRGMPFKLSLNEKDGVIDVDVASPALSESAALLDLYTVPSHSHKSDSYPHHPSNVAGYIPSFHHDVVLQAVKPYDDLVRDIKRAMSAEPTPPLPLLKDLLSTSLPNEKWIPVATTLIVDIRAFTVRRLNLLRRIRVPSVNGQNNGGTPTHLLHRHLDAPCVPPQTLAEEFSLDSITSADTEPVLAKAMERLLPQSSGQHTRVPSRSGSLKHGQGQQSDVRDDAAGAVPRQEVKKTVLAALEEILESAMPGTSGGTGRTSALREALGKMMLEQMARPLELSTVGVPPASM